MLTQLLPLLITLLSAMSSIISRYSSVHGQKFRSSTVTSKTQIHPKKVFPVYQNGKNKIISVTQTMAVTSTNKNVEVVLSASLARAGTTGNQYNVSSPALRPVRGPAQRPAKPALKPEQKPVIRPTKPAGNKPARKPAESSENTSVFKPTVPANVKPFIEPAQTPPNAKPFIKPAQTPPNAKPFIKPAQTPPNAKPFIKPAQTPPNAKPFIKPAQTPPNAKPFIKPAQTPPNAKPFIKPAQTPPNAKPFIKPAQTPPNAKPFIKPAQTPPNAKPFIKPAQTPPNAKPFIKPAQTPPNAKPFIKPAQTPPNAKPFIKPAQKPTNAKPFLRPAQTPGIESGNSNIGKSPSQIPTTAAPVRTVDQTNGIQYHGGPVMMDTVNIYYIWHGNWGDNTARNILEFFAANIGGSSWCDIQTTYTDGSGVPISNSVLFKQSANSTYVAADPYDLSGPDITSIFTTTLDSEAVPVDDNGVYFILTAPDVRPSGFASQYCGWYSFIDYKGVTLKFALVGNAININPWGCIGDPDHSPNGNPGADGMADVIAHELVEAVTDPLLNSGWFSDLDNYENADKCMWNYGDAMTEDSNGGYYNMVLGNHTGSQKKFLIQKNWLNANGGYCALRRP